MRLMRFVRCLIVGAVLLISMVGLSAPAKAQQTAQRTHVVQAGDTLFQIALSNGVTVEELVAANGLANPSQIEIGQVLIIPGAAAAPAPAANVTGRGNTSGGPVYYVVQVGDTLNRIAQLYGVTPAAITAANGLADANHIEIGQSLLIPGLSAPGGSATAPTVPTAPVVSNPPAVPTATNMPPTAAPPTATIPPAAPTAVVPLRTHVVQPGEDLASIANQYNVNWPDIVALNNITDPNLLFAGMVLKIPNSPGTPLTTMETSGGAPPGPITSAASDVAGKRIVVILHEQRVYAYQDGQLVRNVLVSTGLPGTPTVTGTFHIYVKYTAQLMVGPDYYLPNVPWVMYFYQGYSLHGTYWHHNWGHPMSHGCVNMPTDEALWLYDWAPVGTEVTVMW
jgi:LysM repeat protein